MTRPQPSYDRIKEEAIAFVEAVLANEAKPDNPLLFTEVLHGDERVLWNALKRSVLQMRRGVRP